MTSEALRGVSVEGRQFASLATGAARRLFRGDQQVTDELLLSVLDETSLTVPERRGLVAVVETLLKRGAKENWTAEDAAAAAREAGAQDEIQAAFARVWGKERGNAHAWALEQLRMAPKLQAFNWRTDVLSMSRDTKEMSTPAAIAELVLSSGVQGGDGVDSKGTTVRFEMTRDDVRNLHAEVTRISDAIHRTTE